MITGFRHAGIVVRDLGASLAFYRDMLGLTVRARKAEEGPSIDTVLGLEGVKVTTVKLAPPEGGGMVELLSFASHPAPRGISRTVYTPGPTHVAFTVRDLDALFEALTREGVPFLSGPARSADGSVRVCFCRDPDGTLVELVEPQQGNTPP